MIDKQFEKEEFKKKRKRKRKIPLYEKHWKRLHRSRSFRL